MLLICNECVRSIGRRSVTDALVFYLHFDLILMQLHNKLSSKSDSKTEIYRFFVST